MTNNNYIDVNLKPIEFDVKATGNIAKTLGLTVAGIGCAISTAYVKDTKAKTALLCFTIIFLSCATYNGIK